MNKKHKILVLLATVIIFMLFLSNLFLSQEGKLLFNSFIENTSEGGKWSPYYDYVSWGVAIILPTTFSRIGFLLARKKGLNPWKWAKYCFWGTVLALAYLYYIEDEREA